MHKGHLVNVKAHIDFQGQGPYIILRGPYESATTSIMAGNKITEITTCVDLLSSTGDIFEAIGCKILERVE
ncbi:MAG: hypothetical protein H8E12_10445 [Rhodobacteraceae bacterium]|nr:hypothetical protein [Paracoccaceae bacterium]